MSSIEELAAKAHAEPAKAKVGGSGYLVLRVVSDAPGAPWNTVTTVQASSADAAIRSVVAKLSEADQAGTFVAVPARSWKPVTVTAKVTTSLVLESAS